MVLLWGILVLLAEIMFIGINLTALSYLRPALEVKTMSARNIPSVQLTILHEPYWSSQRGDAFIDSGREQRPSPLERGSLPPGGRKTSDTRKLWWKSVDSSDTESFTLNRDDSYRLLTIINDTDSFRHKSIQNLDK